MPEPENRRKIMVAILSLSLLMIMAGAAVSPVLADISRHFSQAHPQLVKMIITLPALMMIPFSFLTGMLAKKYRKKNLILLGLLGYIAGGIGGGLANSITAMLFFRALLGAGLGVISPLTISLIADYFLAGERTKMMGYASASNNLGGGVATIMAGILALYNWRWVFFIYALAVLVFLVVLLLLPREAGWCPSANLEHDQARWLRTSYCILRWGGFSFLVIIIFFSIPTHLDIFLYAEKLGTSATTGWLIGLLTGISFLTGIIYQKVVSRLRDYTILFSFLLFLVSFSILSFSHHIFFISIAIVFSGAAMGMLIPLIMESVTFEVRPGDVIYALSIINLALYLGQFVSPLLSGLLGSLLPTTSIRFPFYVSALITVLAILTTFIKKIAHLTPGKNPPKN